jgi:hypothetical protein
VASGVLDSPLQAVHAPVRVEKPARYGTAVKYRSLLSGKPEPDGATCALSVMAGKTARAWDVVSSSWALFSARGRLEAASSQALAGSSSWKGTPSSSSVEKALAKSCRQSSLHVNELNGWSHRDGIR